MKALGHDPTKQELDDMVQLVDTDESNTIDFQEFLTLMALRIKQPFTEEEVMDAFLVRCSRAAARACGAASPRVARRNSTKRTLALFRRTRCAI